jgi:hypothetical protein
MQHPVAQSSEKYYLLQKIPPPSSLGINVFASAGGNTMHSAKRGVQKNTPPLFA